MRCARCGWPTDEATVLSTHHTSQGWIRYRRCVCGTVCVQRITLDVTPERTRTTLVAAPTPSS